MKISKILLACALAAGTVSSASASSVVHIVGSTAFRAGATTAVIDYLSQAGPVTVVFKNASPSGNVIKDLVGGGAASFVGTLPSDSDAVTVESFWTGSLAGTVDVALSGISGIYTGKYVNGPASITAAGNPAPSTTYTDNGNTVSVYELSSVTTDDSNISGPEMAFSNVDETTLLDSMADVNSSIPGYTSTPTLISAITNSAVVDAGGAGSATNTAGTVGVLPTQWVLGNPTGGGESATNITSQAAKCALSKGYVQFSQLSGLATDGTNFAVVVGRSEDSGSRPLTFCEAQVMEAANWDFAPKQVNVTFSPNVKTESSLTSSDPGYQVGGAGADVATITLWPANYALNPTQPNLSWSPAGHAGQYSGGDVANVLSAANNSFWSTAAHINSSVLSHTHVSEFTGGTSKVALMGYVGNPDAATAQGNSAIPLSYNGVPYSYSAVESGQYSCWGYEHLYYCTAGSNTISGDAQAFADGLATEIFTTDADLDVNATGHHIDQGQSGTAAGVLYGDMKVKRNVPAGEYIYNK